MRLTRSWTYVASIYTDSGDSEHITLSQVQEAIASLNKRKTPDYHGVQVKHLLVSRQFTDKTDTYFGDSSPTYLKTVHRQINILEYEK